MAPSDLRKLQTWRSDLTERLAGWISLDPVSELRELKHPRVLMSEVGFALASSRQQDEPHIVAMDRLDLKSGQRIIVSVDTALCFRRSVDVRTTAPAKIEKILDLELARILPHSPGTFLAGHSVVESDPTRNTSKVEQIVLRKAILEPFLAHCRLRGWRVAAITFHDDLNGPVPVAIDPDGGPLRRRRFEQWRRASLFSIVVLGLSGGAVAWAIEAHTESIRTRIAAETTDLQARVNVIQHRLDKLKSTSEETASLVSWQRESPLAPLVIEDLSAILPDDAFLESVSIDGPSISVEGQASTPERLIAALEASPHFKDVAFSAPVYRNPNDSKSRFALRLTVETPQAEASR